MKKISEEKLIEAEAYAAVRVNPMNRFTTDIYSAVADIKAANELGMSIEAPWDRLGEILEVARIEGDSSALSDVQKALENLQVEALQITVTSGKQKWELSRGLIKNRPRSRVTMALVQSIRNLQGRSNRAPTRQEILDEMNKSLVGGADETEVSRQLTRLGWNDLI